MLSGFVSDKHDLQSFKLGILAKKRYRQSISTVTKIMSWFELKKRLCVGLLQ
jgi:hypothetical protein